MKHGLSAWAQLTLDVMRPPFHVPREVVVGELAGQGLDGKVVAALFGVAPLDRT